MRVVVSHMGTLDATDLCAAATRVTFDVIETFKPTRIPRATVRVRPTQPR
jgi:hypothetical protein